MTPKVERLLQKIKIGDHAKFYFGTKEAQNTVEGIYTEIDEFFLYVKKADGLIASIDLDDLRTLEQTTGINKPDVPEYRIMRTFVALPQAQPYDFNTEDWIAHLKELIKNTFSYSLRASYLSILDSMNVAIRNNNLDYKAHDLRARLLQLWEQCNDDLDFEVFYLFLGILSIVTKEYEYALEPLVRAKQYKLAAYAATEGKLTAYTQEMVLCALLSKDSTAIDKYISETCVSLKDVEVLKKLLEIYRNDNEQCEKIASCAYMIFMASNSKLSSDITLYFTPYEAANQLLNSIDTNWSVPSTILPRWNEYAQYSYPVMQDTSDPIEEDTVLVGTLNQFNPLRRNGWIAPNHYFYIEQVLDYNDSGLLLRQVLAADLWQQLEVRFELGESSVIPGASAAHRIELTEKGYAEAQMRIARGKKYVERKYGSVEVFWNNYENGRIISNGTKYKFNLNGIIDPWMKAYYRSCSFPTFLRVTFEVAGDRAVNICCVEDIPADRSSYASYVTQVDIEAWERFQSKENAKSKPIVLPEKDPYDDFPYTELGEWIPKEKNTRGNPLSWSKRIAPKSTLPANVSVDLPSHYVEGENFGILAICSTHSAKIFRIYEPGGKIETTEKAVLFNPGDIQFSQRKRPNTSKYVYLVRFRQEGLTTNTFSGEIHPTIAKGSIVTIIKAYRRTDVQRLAISEDGKVLDEKLRSTEYTSDNSLNIQDAAETISTLPPPVIGETLALDTRGNQAPDLLCTCTEINGQLCAVSLAGNNMGRIEDLGSHIWRFGCVTDFHPERGVALLNGSWLFQLKAAAPLINILKSQKETTNAVISLYCIFSCQNGVVSDVRRLREVIELIPWTSGTVTSTNRTMSYIEITADNQKMIHRSTVESNPYVNRSFSRGTLVNTAIWLRRVEMAWMTNDGNRVELRPEALYLHSTTQTPTIRYIERTDSFEGYENQTEHFPIHGSATLLKSYVGQAADVAFILAPDGLTLECRLQDELHANETYAEAETVDALNEIEGSFSNTALIRLYLRNADLNQTGLREIDVDESGMPRSAVEAVSAFKKLFQHPINFPKNWQHQLVAAKLALAFPDHIYRSSQIPEMLLGVLRMRMRSVSRSSNIVYGELAYGLSLLMQYDRTGRSDADYYAWLLLQDFGSTEDILNYETSITNQQAITIEQLCKRSLPEDGVEKLLSHLLYMDPMGHERVCSLLENNAPVASMLKNYACAFYDKIRITDSLETIVKRLRVAMHRAFQEYARDMADLAALQSDICDKVSRSTEILSRRWLKLACTEDRDRFLLMKQACDLAVNYVNFGGFMQQEYELTNAWRTMDTLEKECIYHPCRESTEILLLNPHLDENTSLLKRLKDEISARLSRLYSQDSLPNIICELNEESIPLPQFFGGAADIQLIVRNGDSRHMLQAAENVMIRLESLTPGIYVTTEIRLDHRLAAGEEVSVTAYLNVDDEESLVSTDKIIIQWQVEFLYTSTFQNGCSQQSTYNTGDAAEPLVLQLVREQNEIKKLDASNPYTEAAEGNPLPENARVYRHRSEEDIILNSILSQQPDGSTDFRSGATVIVHGQKKSGKTSLINQIKAHIDRDSYLRERAIIIDFDSMLSNIGNVGSLPHFLQSFCDAILQRFNAQKKKHIDLWDLMIKHNLRIPDLLDDDATAYAKFSRFFNTFATLDNGYHTVLLFMDEFTTLCTSLLTEIESAKNRGDYAMVNYLQHIPDFIKDFSGKGFIQVVIGHEAMMRSLDTLGMLNQTKEFATTVEITALTSAEAEALIREPMRDAFGFDPYRTALGASAVDYLRDITGCHPTFLVRACKEIFDYYKDQFPEAKTQLTKRDISIAMTKYISQLQLSNFDILLVEDGDGVENPEERKTYRYLKCAAQLALASYDRRTADIQELSEKMKEILGSEDAERVRSILHARHVIRFTEGGRLRIETGLFLEYIHQRNGGR